jgi:hypothetical protein
MAKIEHLPPKKDRKNFGNLEFYTDKYGNNIMRSKPLDVCPEMKTGRLRMKKLQKLIIHVSENIKTAYAGTVFKKFLGGYNRVFSINIKQCFIGDTDRIDPARFVLCDHDGSFVDNVTLVSNAKDTITGTFDSNAQNEAEGNDPVKVYGFDVSANKIWQFKQDAIRNTGTVTLTHTEMWKHNISVYFECLDRVNLLNGNPKHVIKYVGTLKVQ